MGSWIGGDRDGNPNVNADTMRHAVMRHATTILDFYLDEVHALGAELSTSTLMVDVTPELQTLADRSTDQSDHRADEPYRRALIGIYARLAATARQLGATNILRKEVGHAAPYRDSLEFAGRPRGAGRIAAPEPRRDAGPAPGRPDARCAHLRLPPGLARHAPDFGRARARAGRTVRKSRRRSRLRGPLGRRQGQAAAGRTGQPRLLYSPYESYSDETQSELAIVRAAREIRQRYGARAIRNYIISHTEAVSDLLEVLLLLKEAGLLHPAGGRVRRDGDSAVRDHPRPAARRRHHGSLDGPAAGHALVHTRGGCRKSCSAIRTRTRTAAS
jgi:phosphoenolpyruvate carboxylase